MKALLVLALLLTGLAAAVPAGVPVGLPPAQPDPSPAVLLIGAPGLRWEDVSTDRTPALTRLAAAGSTGVLSVRSANPGTCPADGWLMAGAGNRARAGPASNSPCPDAGPGPGALGGIAADNARLRHDAEIGALASLVTAAGRCLYGSGGGAEHLTGVPAGPVPPAGCALLVVDAGPVHHDDRRDGDLRRVDRLVAAEAGPTLAAGGTVLVAGLADTSDRGEVGQPEPHLHVAVAAGPAFPGGSLRSASTRRAPYVQVIDLAPTVLSLLGLPQPATMAGQPWQRDPQRYTAGALADLDRKAGAMRRSTVPFFVLLFSGQILLYGGALALSRRPTRRKALRRGVYLVALIGTAIPGATYLANLLPWWRATPALPALLGSVALFTAGVVAVALAGPWRRSLLGPAGAVCAVTALVLVVDLVTGARLQMSSVAGYSPLVAGRFAGIGNVAFGVLAAGALLATACLVQGRPRRPALLTCTAVGLLTVIVDGSPSWGSDLGGVLALVPGFAVLAMVATGIRVSALRLTAVAAGAVLPVALFAALDYLRDPQDRSHLGRFAAQLVEGDAATVLQRKAAANLDLLTANPATLIVPVAVLLAAWLVLRRPSPLGTSLERAAAWRAGLIAVLVTGVVGFAVNDSGVAVPALVLAVAAPAAVAVAVRAAR